MPFCSPIATNSSSEFLRLCREWDSWHLSRMQYCGGWSAGIADAYRARALGAYYFTSDQITQLETIASQLGYLYRRLGVGIQSKILNATSEEEVVNISDPWLEGYSVVEKQILLQSIGRTKKCAPFNWATTLRADFIWTADGPKIVEVNSDNVGGIEDLMIQLSFYADRHDVEEALRNPIQNSLRHLQQNVADWMSYHWCQYRDQSARHPQNPTVAFLSEDWDHSLFLSKYLHSAMAKCEQLLGWDIQSCRVDMLHESPVGLEIEDIWGCRRPVHLLMRNWLFHEMFADDKTLKQKFEKVLRAAADGSVLVLNPFHDRLLFSKDWLRRLWSRSDLPIDLTEEEIQFVKTYFARTERAMPDDLGRQDIVIKPINEFGGRGVVYSAEGMEASGRIPRPEELSKETWIKQPIMRMEQPTTWLRTQIVGGEPMIASRHEMRLILGLVIHGIANPRLSGIPVRMGVDPVVNWGRGAQVIPGLLG